MKTKLSSFLCLLFGIAVSLSNAEDGFWPEGKRYCVTLTYDDGIQSQIDNALPQLNEAGLQGTFFFAGSPTALWTQDEIDSLKAGGHELAGHTLLHPCSRDLDFVSEGNGLEDYDDERMGKELDENLANLLSNGAAQGQVTFAYPCGSTYIGEDKRSYMPLVNDRFLAARGTTPSLGQPGKIDLQMVDAISGHVGGSKEPLEWMAKAREQGAWAVYMFHGVGGDYLTISAEDHQILLNALRSDDQVWVATFTEAAAWVNQQQVGQE